jgi:DNA-binding GntR family transcriptional regulator
MVWTESGQWVVNIIVNKMVCCSSTIDEPLRVAITAYTVFARDQDLADHAEKVSTGDFEIGASDEQKIVERIYAAVIEQRLPPKTKLSEAMLCESFGVGRMPVRRALLLLASQGIVDLHSNRGAFVSSPSRKEVRDVFDARLALEPSIVRQVAEHAEPSVLDALERHIQQEQQAKDGRNRREAIRLSGEFHVKLAAATGNAVLIRMLRELVTRTSLIIGLFGTSDVSSCEEREHGCILDALRKRDGNAADTLIRTHLAHIEANLDLGAGGASEPNLTRIFGSL